MKVYQAINAVQAEIASVGIAKDKRNTQGSGYNFRGIDDVYNALSPIMSKHGLVIIPRCLERDQVERQAKSGGALFYTTLRVEFDFVSSEDGSKHTACAYGEAMDSGDKSTNKAMSAAFKYAMFQTFCIPTEAQDADAETHEVKPQVKREGQPTSGIWESMPIDDKNDLLAVAQTCNEYFESSDVVGLVDYLERQRLDNDHKAALWTQLGSRVRTAIKKEHEARRQAA